MEIRELEHNDLDQLLRFVLDSYDDYPSAMWFDSRPKKEDLERVFYSKINGTKSGLLADMVAEEDGVIIAECEIVRTYTESGVVGILVRKEYSKRGIGTKLLDSAIAAAKDIGIYKLKAEVMADNENAVRFFIVNGFVPLGTSRVKKKGGQYTIVVLERNVR